MKPAWPALCLLLPALASAQPSFHADVHLIGVGFSVWNAQGKLVTDLQQDDFEVLEDGVPQKIAFFARSTDVPLNLGLIVDVSGSQEPFVKPHRKDLETFLKTTLGKTDRAFLVCFGNRLRLVEDFSSSGKELAEALNDFKPGRTVTVFRRKQPMRGEPRDISYPELGPPERRILGTAFYDAIFYPITEMLAKAEGGRRALIVFSDGEDNSSAHHMMEAIEEAQANNVLLFMVRYTDIVGGRPNARNKYGISVMERMARETGGADFDAREKGLAENFKQIGEQLRSSYELAYHSTNSSSDGTFRKIAIRAKPPGLTVRAKTGYYAR